jgi:hypothetical protein
MQTQVGNCFVEYIWPAHGTTTPEVLGRFPFWSSEPNVEYFRSLAHAGVKSFYRVDHHNLEQMSVDGSHRVFAAAVRIVDQDGKEICRWTTEDEFEEVQHES